MSPSGVLAAGLPRRRAIIGPAYARERTFPLPRRSPQERRRERVADRNRERVGGVVRRRELREREDHLHHPLHLRLLGAAVAADGLLDAGRRVLAAGDSLVGGR